MAGAIVDQKLESLRRCVARIAARCPDSAAALAADLDARDIVALNLTRAIQLCVDIAAHRLAARPDTAAPQTMGETFTVAAQGGMLDAALATRLRRAVGFRDIMIHNYEAADWDIVFYLCTQRLDDFRLFARALSPTPSPASGREAKAS